MERPLRLRFQITGEGKESFLDACPDFLEAVMAMEAELGHEPCDDWNEVWAKVQPMAKENDAKWTVANKKLFRQCFTSVEKDARPVVAKVLKSSQIFDSAFFPNQKLPSDLNQDEIDAVCGVYKMKDGKKTRKKIFEPDPALRDYEKIPLQEDIVFFS